MSTSLTHPHTDPIWPRLTHDQRREAGMWIDMIRELDAAKNKGVAVAIILRDYAGVKGLSKTTLYKKRAAYKKHGVAGLVHGAIVKAITGAGSALPQEFVQFWHGLCGLHQRQKAASVRRHLMLDHLAAGKIIPGYDTDWRGIYASEHPDREVPARCPYAPGGQHPRGWSYRNLSLLKPAKDVWAGAAQGVQAMRALLPSIPHTRVGLPFGSLFIIDDVWHDHKVLFLGAAQAERPLELGMMEALTGRYVSWGLTPVRRRADGTREMLKESYVRYLIVDLLCRVGVHPAGVLIHAEHGTAAVRGPLLDEINAEIQRLTGIAEFVKVDTSSVAGAPLVAGLYAERPRGNPRFKAMLESSWNLLHNELAMLPGQVGKDRDNSPQDIKGRDQETKALAPIVNALLEECPTEIAEMVQSAYMSFYDFEKVLLKVKTLIENRTDHNLEGWEQCRFVRKVAVIGGVEVDLAAQAADNPGAVEELNQLIRITRASVRLTPMSPAAAYRKVSQEQELRRFPLSLAAIILGEACGTRAKVSDRGTLTITDALTGKQRYTFNAIVTDAAGRVAELPRGVEFVCNLNPFDGSTLLVSDTEGRYLGHNAAPYKATIHGDTESAKANLALLSQAAALQRKRLAPVIAEQQARTRFERKRSTDALLGTLPTQRVLGDGKAANLSDFTGSGHSDERPTYQDDFTDEETANVGIDILATLNN